MIRRHDPYPSRHARAPRLLARDDPVVWGHVADGPLTRAELERYERDGYLLLPQLFEGTELAGIVQEFESVATTQTGRRSVREPGADHAHTMFSLHRTNRTIRRLCRDPRLLRPALQILDGTVYVHQSRAHVRADIEHRSFGWHSAFETWHHEDGMPRMRAVSCVVALTPDAAGDAPLALIPGSHRVFIGAVRDRPAADERRDAGSPDETTLHRLVQEMGVRSMRFAPGTVLLFDCNLLHRSFEGRQSAPRTDLWLAYNSFENKLDAPYRHGPRRPNHLADPDPEPLVLEG